MGDDASLKDLQSLSLLSITNSGNAFNLIEKEAAHQDSGVVDQNKIGVNQV